MPHQACIRKSYGASSVAMRTSLVLLTVLVLASGAFAQAPSAAPSPMSTAPEVLWPAPEGWRTERIPFPLDFAPSLTYKGYEELRFSPAFGKADQPLFFTYAFLWVIPADVELKRDAVERDLKVYFDGLMKAVAESNKFDGAFIDSKVSVTDAPQGPDRVTWNVQVETFDSFFTRKPISLVMHVIANVKSLPGWRVHYFEATTAPLKNEVLPSLQILRASLVAAPVAPTPIQSGPPSISGH